MIISASNFKGLDVGSLYLIKVGPWHRSSFHVYHINILSDNCIDHESFKGHQITVTKLDQLDAGNIFLVIGTNNKSEPWLCNRYNFKSTDQLIYYLILHKEKAMILQMPLHKDYIWQIEKLV